MDELRHLKRFASSKTVQAIGADLGRSASSVKGKANKLKICMVKEGQNNPGAKLSDMQVEMIRALADAGFRITDIHASCFSYVSYNQLVRIKRIESRLNALRYTQDA